MTSKSIRDYINIVENLQSGDVAEEAGSKKITSKTVTEGPLIPIKPPPRGDFRERFNNRFALKFARSIAPRVFADHRRLNAYSQVQRHGFAIAREELGSQQRLNDLITDTEFVTYLGDAYFAIQEKAENRGK